MACEPMEIGSDSKDHLGSRVHFPEDQLAEHDNEIVIRMENETDYTVHLGFLKYKHHYTVSFSIKDKLSEDLTFDPLQNLHVKIQEVMPSEDGEGHIFLIDLSAYKEKLLKESLILKDSVDSSKQICLTLCARVLGKGKGTPALRNGIKCTAIDIDEDSEQSDWQGFD